jgi:hypothetical protein
MSHGAGERHKGGSFESVHARHAPPSGLTPSKPQPSLRSASPRRSKHAKRDDFPNFLLTEEARILSEQISEFSLA